jgi:signal transduction histidine kinase
MLTLSWKRLSVVVLLAVAFLVYFYVVAEVGRTRLAAAAEQLRETQARRILIGDLQQYLSDAESGHRGFMVTGDERYLEPLEYASQHINQTADALTESYRREDQAMADNSRRLRFAAGEKIGEINASVALFRAQGQSAALALARTHVGQHAMEKFRNLARAMRDYEAAKVDKALVEWNRVLQIVSWMNLGASILNIGLISLAGGVILRDMRRRTAANAILEREREALAAEASARAAELTEVYGYLQKVQEEERSRLARGLHDELGGVLLAARMDVSWLQRHSQTTAKEVQERLARVQKALDEGISLKRRVVEELRPTLLDNMGLVAALRWQMEESCARAGLACTERFPDTEPTFTPNASIAIFRIVQEALANVLKHAKASEVEVSLETIDQDLVVSVRDNGVGIPAECVKPRAHGLAGMRHRVFVLGGQMWVGRAPGGGTEIRAMIPLANIVAPAPSSTDETATSGTYRILVPPRADPQTT